MRITTWNVNGLRAALRKGFAKHVRRVRPDVMLLQEVRALQEQLPKPWGKPRGWNAVWHPAEKLGYAGTAVWGRGETEELGRGIDAADPEGRVLSARVDGVRVVSVYLPSGSSGEHRQAAKEEWMSGFLPWAEKLAASDEPVVMGGDFNIAHTVQDIFYAKGNEKNSGFLPHERSWFGDLLDAGWRDVVREAAGDVDGPYSWWSNRGQARALDRGWRIDYLLCNRAAAGLVTGVSTDRKSGMEVSDHAMVSVDLAV